MCLCDMIPSCVDDADPFPALLPGPPFLALLEHDPEAVCALGSHYLAWYGEWPPGFEWCGEGDPLVNPWTEDGDNETFDF